MMRRSLLLAAGITVALLAIAPSAFAQISSISPTSAPAGSGPVTLTINGQFPYGTASPTVYWFVPSTSQQTTLNITGTPTPTQIMVTVPANLLTQPETAEIFLNSDSSNYQIFTVTTVPPTLTSLSPNSAVAGSPTLTLTVNGANFPPPSSSGSISVTWNGSVLQTTYVNSGQMTAIVPAPLLAAVGTASVNITSQPQPSPLTFTITAPPMVLSSISPNTIVAGSPGFTLTVNGSGFNDATAVTWNGSSLNSGFVSSTQLTAAVPANLIATAGTASVGVAAYGQTSPAPLAFAIIPSLTSLSPSSAVAGGPAFTLTVNGTGFTSGTVLNWNAQPLSSTVANPNQLAVTVPASFIAQAGSVPITVTSGGRVSNALQFNITAAALTLSSVSPNTTAAGGPAFTITVNGSGFLNGSVVTWNGASLGTTFVSTGQLTATVPANLIAAPGSAAVGISVPGQISPAPLSFVITPSLTLTSLSPSSAVAGSPSFSLSVNGAGFAAGASILWNGLALSTIVVNANLATANVPANLIAQQGSANITAQNGNVISNALSFSITAPQPAVTLTSLSPSGALVGSPAFTLTVNGSGFTAGTFAPGTVVSWNGSPLATTFVSGTQVTAAVPATLLTTAGTVAVSVTGSPQPASLPFTITSPLTLTGISPSTIVAGGQAFSLTANGAGFTSTTAITWNGIPLATNFVSSRQLNAVIPATLIASPGTELVDVSAAANQTTPAALQFVITPNLNLTSLSPSSATAGGPAFTLGVNGTGFVPGATVCWNGAALTTTFVSATQLTAAVSVGLIAQPGSASVTVIIDNLVSNALSFIITAPAPVIRSISPSSVIAGSPGLTLTVTGSGFLAGAVVSLNSAPLTTTFVSATQLTAAIPANLIAQPGTAPITVSNTAGAASNAVSLTIAPPTPAITSITPPTVTSGGPAFTLTVTGTNFLTGATVSFNSTALTTAFVSATQLTAAVPASLIAQAGSAQITAANTGGAASNAVSLTIAPPTPTISSITPSTVTSGSPAITLTVTGTNFLTGATVSFNSTALTTTFVSATQLTAAVPASLIAQAGSAQITAANAGGAASNAVTLTIAVPVPTLTSIAPSTVTQGGPAFTLTVNGTNFVTAATVSLGTTALTTTFVSSTQLTAAVSASFIQQPGSLPVTVTNPGSAPSSPLPLTVNPVPAISSISPSSVTAGGPAFTLTVNGTGFFPGASVLVNNTSLVPTIVSSTQLTALVPANLIAQPGTAQVIIGSLGGAQSNAVTLTITPAPPTLTRISPNSANVGDPTFTISLTGTGFVQASIVQWNGAPLGTTFVSNTQLTATVDAGRLILPATAGVTVMNQVPEGPPLVSNALTFTINPVTPLISSLSPNSAIAGGPAFSLVVNGAGLLALTTIQWNTTALTTHFVSATQVTADVPATLLAQAGAVTVTAVNPGNQVSAAFTFTINPPAAPVITSLSQTSATAGSAAFTLTVTGTGFTTAAVVNLGSNALPTTFVSATQLTAAVSANLLLVPANYQIVVQQAGASSNAVTFTISLPAPPSLRLNPPTTSGPAQQPTIDFGLNAGYPLALSGTVTLTFASNATIPVDDPSIQFAGGGRTLTFTVPANTTALPALMIQTGTVSGVITLNVTLTAAGVNVTPTTGSIATITVAKSAPIIRTVTLIHAAGYLEVDINGFSTTRDMTTAVFQLTAAPGGSFTSSVITVPVSSLFTTWYQGSASTAFGSQFTYAQPFTVIGDTNEIVSVTVTLTNSAGTSASGASH